MAEFLDGSILRSNHEIVGNERFANSTFYQAIALRKTGVKELKLPHILIDHGIQSSNVIS